MNNIKINIEYEKNKFQLKKKHDQKILEIQKILLMMIKDNKTDEGIKMIKIILKSL